MTKHERAGLVETHKAHLLCLCARATGVRPRGFRSLRVSDGRLRW
jgi:hypothetical protein